MVANYDRLSLLPDKLLFVIVSLLPFKDAVRMSILSKRWRFIPLGTRNMEFNESDFVAQAQVPEDIRENQRRGFVDFVLRWINERCSDNTGPDKFSLSFSHPEDHLFQVQQCIKFAVDREVEVLDLDFSDPTWDEDDIENHREHTLLQLPLINNGELKTLQSLKLFSCNIVPSNSSTSHNFSALRCVSLGWVTMTPFCMNNLLNKCPSLEILSMRRCSYFDFIEIVSKSLKSLIMEKCCPNESDMMLYFRIDAPKLKLFKYSGVLVSLSFGSLNLDMEACLDFGLQRDYDEYGDIVYELLNEIGGVKTLTVCTYVLQVIACAEEPFGLLPELERLRHLILKASLHRDEFYGISFFLNSCPNLEVLTIDLNTPARIFPEYDPPLEMHQHAFLMKGPYALVFPCVEKKLKKVVVEGFKGTRNELVVLKYFVKYGRVLDELRIKISSERAPNGSSKEAAYVQKAHSLLNFNIANRGLRILLSRRA